MAVAKEGLKGNMKGVIVYILKEGADLNGFAKLGWDIDDDGTIFKVVKQPVDGGAAKYLLKNYYNNPLWKDRFYKGHEMNFKDKLGLEYDEKGEIIMNDEIESILTDWYIMVDTKDAEEGLTMIGFGNKDPYDIHVFYGKGILEKYCKEEIEKLLDADLIEEYEELPVA